MAASSSSSRQPTRIMVALSESNIKGYPYASMSSRVAFDWTLKNIVSSNASAFYLKLIHVQILTKDARGCYAFGNPIEEHPTEEQIRKYYEEERKKEEDGGPGNVVMHFGSSKPVLIRLAGKQEKEKHRMTAPGRAVQFVLDGISVPAPEEYKTLKIISEEKGIKLLDYFVKQCNDLGAACETMVAVGAPAGVVICNAAATFRPDFIVVGNRGLNLIQGVVAGTVSEYCIKNATCPVIAIKRPVTLTPENPIDD